MLAHDLCPCPLAEGGPELFLYLYLFGLVGKPCLSHDRPKPMLLAMELLRPRLLLQPAMCIAHGIAVRVVDDSLAAAASEQGGIL